MNTLSPGATETSGLAKLASTPAELDRIKSSLIATIPMGRMGTPMKSPRPRCCWRRTTAATSMASNCSSMVAWRKFNHE